MTQYMFSLADGRLLHTTYRSADSGWYRPGKWRASWVKTSARWSRPQAALIRLARASPSGSWLPLPGACGTPCEPRMDPGRTATWPGRWGTLVSCGCRRRWCPVRLRVDPVHFCDRGRPDSAHDAQLDVGGRGCL